MLFLQMENFVKSKYEGETLEECFHGKGKYTFDDGTVYLGEFFNGHFHGTGQLVFSNGNRIEGKWTNGILVNKTLFFADNLQYQQESWDYCTDKDRRFHFERLTEIKPIDQTLLSNDPKGLKAIKPGHYGSINRHPNRCF